jgi:hypothetical protein
MLRRRARIGCERARRQIMPDIRDAYRTATIGVAQPHAHHDLFTYRARYRPRRQPDGTWHIHRPDGTTVTPPDAA